MRTHTRTYTHIYSETLQLREPMCEGVSLLFLPPQEGT